MTLLSRTDLKLALRMIGKTPGLTVMAVLALAVGIGLSTAAFSLTRAIFYTALPFEDGDRIVRVRDRVTSRGLDVQLSAEELSRRRDQSTLFEDLGGWYERRESIEVRGSSAGIAEVTYLTPNSFSIVGAVPLHGRIPLESDVTFEGDPVVLLSHGLWRREFSEGRDVIGSVMRVGGVPHTVIGVMPPEFGFPIRQDVWVPVQTDSSRGPATGEKLNTFGKLAEDVSAETAAAQLASMVDRVPSSGYADEQLTPMVVPFTKGTADPEMEIVLWVVVAALVMVLVVAAANVANLLLARTSARVNELAIRAAMGARRARIVFQLVIEALILASLAAIPGVALAQWGLGWIKAKVDDMPFWVDFSIDPVILGFVVAVTCLAAVVAGATPALKATGVELQQVLKGSAGATSIRFGKVSAALIVVEVALSVGFIGGASVLGRGLFNYGRPDYGIPADRILVAQIFLGMPANENQSTREEWDEFLSACDDRRESIETRLREIESVSGVSSAMHFPGNDELRRTSMEIETSTGVRAIQSRVADVGHGYFDLLGGKVREGRDLDRSEYEHDARLAIVNESFRGRYFPEGTPIGSRVRSVFTSQDGTVSRGEWREIVGVVPDLGLSLGDPSQEDGVYVPLARSNVIRVGLGVSGEPGLVLPRVYDEIHRIDPQARVQWVSTVAEQIQMSQLLLRGLGTTAVLIGAIAMLLSTASLFAIMSCAVTQRTREIGVRMALGAEAWDVMTVVMRRGVGQLALGIVAGSGLGAGIARLTNLLPIEIQQGSLGLLLAVVVLMAASGTLACIIPGRRALAIEPVNALRHE